MAIKDLFRPKWKHSNPDVRKKAIEKLEDQQLLADIAKNDKHEDVRRAAVEKLKDQEILADIAQNDESGGVRQAAVKNLTDQNVLAEIAKKDKNYSVRIEAVNKLDDQEVISQIVKADDNQSVRSIAEKKLIDCQILKYDYRSPEIKSFFEELKRKEKDLNERERKMMWINTAEEMKEKRQFLFAVQCYLELINVDPIGVLGNVSWNWIKKVWVGNGGISKNQDENWVYISSKDKEINEIFNKISPLPIIIVDRTVREREFRKFKKEEMILLTTKLRGIFGLPGQIPPRENIYMINTGENVEWAKEEKNEIPNEIPKDMMATFNPDCPLCFSKLGEISMVKRLGGSSITCPNCKEKVSYRYDTDNGQLIVRMFTIPMNQTDPGELTFQPIDDELK